MSLLMGGFPVDALTHSSLISLGEQLVYVPDWLYDQYWATWLLRGARAGTHASGHLAQASLLHNIAGLQFKEVTV